MPNRLNFRWLPYCNSFLLGATAAFCYSQFRHNRSNSAPEPVFRPSFGPRLLASPTPAPVAAGPRPTIAVPAAPVLRTPPLARAKAPKKSAALPDAPATPSAAANPAPPNPGRITRTPIDFGPAAPSTSAEAPAASPLLLPERASTRQAAAKAPSQRPAASRLAAAVPADDATKPRPGSQSGAQTAGDQTNSGSSSSTVAAGATRPDNSAAVPARASDAAAASGAASTTGSSTSESTSASTSGAASGPSASTSQASAAEMSELEQALSTQSGPPATGSVAPSSGAAPASDGAAPSTGEAASAPGASAPETSEPPASTSQTAVNASEASDTSLAPANGSTLPERAEAGISSRDGTSKTNALSPLPPEAQMPLPSVSAPLPSVNASTINAGQTDAGTVRPGPEPLLAPIGVPASAGQTVASGNEAPARDFGFSSDTPVLIDDERGIMLAQGRVTLRYGAFTATGKRGVLYSKASPRTAQLSDDLTVVARVNGREQLFRGESLTFNLDTGRWELTDIRATFPADLFPRGQVLEPLFLRDGRVFGTDEDAGGSDFKFSSCDEDHYYLQSREINFYRDEGGRPDRIALKHNALYVFGRKVLPLPNLVIPLQGRGSRRSFLQPQVGRNEIDGFFAKTVYDLSANSKRTDSLLIDALQKRGLGLGLQRELANGAGLFYLYAVSGGQSGREVDSRLERNFNLGRSVNPSSINYQSTTNNSLTGAGYSTSSGALNLNYAPESNLSSASLQFSTNNSKNPFSTFSQRQGTLEYRRQFGANWDVLLDTQYNSTQSSNQALEGEATSSDKQEILDNRLNLNRRGTRFDAALRAELHDDLTGQLQRNGAYAREKLPELELISDSQRLGLGGLGRFLPGDIVLSLGTYNEPETLQRLTRTRFEYNVRNRELRLINSKALRSRLDLSGGFRQNAYSDNTARYDTEALVGFTTELGRQKQDAGGGLFSLLRFQANYQKLKPTGYTPFLFDAFPANELATATAILQPSRRARLEVSGSRDIQNNSNSPLRGTLRLQPSRFIGIDVSTTYSRELRQFSDVLSTVEVRRPRERFLGGEITLGLAYSPEQSTFSRINLGADVQLNDKTRLVAFAGYDGISKRFDVQQYRVQRDLHCFNLFLGYDAQRKQVRFDLALKAFPFTDSRLGQNILGEGFDPALGAVR